ncbi:MAG: protoheme IX farnesyltransferase [Magnetococcales bacterium]|nr:protoheme IX farnesyltransferase [Magnetococcales bacterium]
MATHIKNYIELLKLRIGGMIALTAVVSYLAMAPEYSGVHLLQLVLVMLLGASSSAVFNHWYDRDIDRIMPRTANRPLAREALPHADHALWLAGGLLVSGVGLAYQFFNVAVAIHLFLGAFSYGIVYTVWLKRRSRLNIVLGGLAGSFAVLSGAATVSPELTALPLSLALVLFFWTPSHFWSLAIHLKEEYRQVGIPMLPVVVGEKQTALFIFVNSLMLVAASMLPYLYHQLGGIYLLGATVAGVLFLIGNWRMIQLPTREMGWSNFIGSMRYLGILFVAIVIDVNLTLV